MKARETKCSHCGASISADLPRGHCPACLLQLGLSAGPDDYFADAPMLKPGDRVGRYQLREIIGEGGCGVVFLAEQAEPLRRLVALKIIKPGMDTRQIIARFDAERQALAWLDHPNIARVFDAGATQSGRPFFVMELVRGAKITEYCDREKLSINARLEMFIEVCLAVQHAHHKGIIHRDLKASNILVGGSIEDLRAAPKIIDFGIAKSLAQPLTEQTLFTAFTQFIGTPACMSPEQAACGADIDTRADIYSLGVLLYELLTARAPFNTDEWQRLTPHEVLRLVREEEPRRPSQRLAGLSAPELRDISNDRATAPAQLLHLVRRDLDCIALKCLEKNRERRYESAAALAADLRRHLDHEPIFAHPPGLLYRLGKTVRRNKPTFAAAAALTTAITLGIGGTGYQSLRIARAERDQARLRTGNAEVAVFLADMIKGTARTTDGRDPAIARQNLERTTIELQRDFAGDPSMQAQLLNLLANTYHGIGLYREMEATARESLRLGRSRPDRENLATARALELLGEALRHLKRPDEAVTAFREGLAMRKKIMGAENPAVTADMENLALALRDQGDLQEAEGILRDALAIDRKSPGVGRSKVLVDLSNLGATFWSENRFAEAEKIYREVLALRRKMDGGGHPDIAASLNNLAAVLASEGKLDEAESLGREALALDRQSPGANHPQLAVALDNLGNILLAQGRDVEAAAFQREAREVTSQ